MRLPRVSLLILAIVTLFLAALVGLRVQSLEVERDAAITRAEEGMRNLTRVAEQYAARVLESADLVSAQVADRVAELGGASALAHNVAVHHWLRDVSQGTAGDYLLVVDAAGQPVATSYAFPVPEVDLSDRRWFQVHAREGAETHVGEALHSRLTDEIMFTFSRTLRRPTGEFDGVVQVAVRTAFFEQPRFGADFGEGTVLALYDAQGRVLARTGLTTGQLGITIAGSPLMQAVASRAHGTLRAASSFGPAERIMAFRRLEGQPVIVVASVPVDEALAAWRTAMRWSFEVIGSVAFGLLLLAALALRLARGEEKAQRALATANAALREAATELEARVAARTRDLAASERRFRGIFDSTVQKIWLLDPDGRLLEVNGTALGLLGLSRAEVLGRRLSDLPCWPDQAARRQVAAAIAEAAEGRPQRAEMTARAADGRLAPLDVSIRPVRDAEETVRWLVAEGHDLTELKAAEAQLREAQKMEALGQLTGGVAHDFNNLLMVVLGNLGLLRKRLPPDPRLTRLIDGAQQGAERGAALTSRMLAFARRQELRPAPVDLAALVRGLRPLLERSAGPTVRLELALPEGLAPAMADANQLELALLNLVVNARDAMPAGGVITIAAGAAEAPAPEAPPGLLPGAYLRLELTDTGSGMDAATLGRATEPFFTTKGVGHGSGLGLSMVRGLAEQSGGGLALRSVPGVGTSAAIWLPRAAEPLRSRAEAPATLAEPEASRPRQVLVVDDDPLVAAGTAMLLEDLGHEVRVAASGEEALALLARDPPVEVVLTDHAMPGMTGLELAERLHRERPGLPVILATGHAEPVLGATWLPRLDKPYRQEDLEALLHRLARAEAA